MKYYYFVLIISLFIVLVLPIDSYGSDYENNILGTEHKIDLEHNINPKEIWTNDSCMMPNESEIILGVSGIGPPIKGPIDVVISIDNSKSTLTTDPENKRINCSIKIANMLKELNRDNIRVAIIVWNSEVSPVYSTGLTDNLTDIIKELSKIETNRVGTTCLCDGLEGSIDEFEKNSTNSTRKVLVFFTDVQPSGRNDTRECIEDQATRAKKRNICS